MRLQIALTLTTFLVYLFLLTGCIRSPKALTQATPETNVSQVRSLTYVGTEQVSFIVEKTRELRITTDGGATWRQISGKQVGGEFECATFLDANRGWAVNRKGQVFSTTEGGTNWKRIAELTDFTGAEDIAFLNESDGWIQEFLSIWHTSDGGLTWQKTLSTLTPGVKGQPTAIYPIDARVLAVSGTEGQVYLTNNNGSNWKLSNLASAADLNDVWFNDRENGWVIGYVGGERFRPLLFATTNGGNSWEEISLSDNKVFPQSLCFVSNEGWLAGHRRDKEGQRSQAVLMHSRDVGQHWSEVQLNSSDPSFGVVRFADEKHGWLAGPDTLYRTTDGGKTWSVVLSLPPIQKSSN